MEWEMSKTWMSNVGRCAAVLALLLGFAGCSWLPEVKDETGNWSAEKLYDEAHGAMVTGNYTRAVKLFDTLEGRFPYGRHAQQAILEGAYANYRQGETALAIAACDRFIRTYPNSTNVDYAYYLKGLVNFREDQGLFGYVVEQDLSERDPRMTKESFGAFKELVTRFPDSRYAADSVDRMRYLTNALGMYEVHVGRYYYNRGAYIAAVNRAAATVTNYPQTPANEQALILLVMGYDKLGMPQLRDDSRRVLAQNFPDSAFLRTGTTKPWWKFWQSDEAVQLLEHDTVPKSQGDFGPPPPSAPNPPN
jgi:outer membrane protein assembly factor BamD